MRVAVVIAPPNSPAFVMDHSSGVIPELVRGVGISANSTCIAVGTMVPADGSTNIAFDDRPPEGAGAPQYDGVVLVPTGTLSVCTVLDEIVLSRRIDAERARVRIWTNHPMEPNEIVIVASKP